MIVTVAQLLAGGVLWIGTELHGWNKGHQAAQAMLIQNQVRYCKPVDELPNDYPQWKIDARKQDCKGVQMYLQNKAPDEKFMSIPVDGEVAKTP